MASELRVDKIVPTGGVASGNSPGTSFVGGGGVIQNISIQLHIKYLSDNFIIGESTGLNINITPKFTTSKIFHMHACCKFWWKDNSYIQFRIHKF